MKLGHTHLQSTARNIGVDTEAAVYRAKEALSTEPKKPYQYLFPSHGALHASANS